MERNLEVTLRWLHDTHAVLVEVYEPECGDFWHITRHDDDRAEFENERIKQEVCAWIDMMFEEAEDYE